MDEKPDQRRAAQGQAQQTQPEQMRDWALELRTAALGTGFVAFGIVTPDRLTAVPASADPARLLAGFRSIVLVAAPGERVTNLGPKSPALLDDQLSFGLARLRREISARGYAALPLLDGRLSLPRLAAAAGMGALAPNGMLVVNRYGLSLYLMALISEAPLPPTPFPGSPADTTICRSCRLCLDDCIATTEKAGFKREWCSGCAECIGRCPLQAR